MGSYGSQKKKKNMVLLHPKLKYSVLHAEEQFQYTKVSIYSEVHVHRAIAPHEQAAELTSPLQREAPVSEVVQ